MATEIMLAPERLAQVKTSCEALVYAPELSTEQLNNLRVTVERVARPAAEEWVRGRIATLLAHYWLDRDGPIELKTAMADDWIAVIMDDPCPPDWAIHKACLAWLSGKDARKKPLPGELRELAIEQMGWVYLIQSRLFMEDHPGSEVWHPLGKYKTGDLASVEGDKSFAMPRLGKM